MSSHSAFLTPHSALLYGILDLGYVAEENAQSITVALLEGGVDILQLRAKNQDLATIRRVAETLLPLCRAAKIPFILNDHPGLAGELGTDGVHIGQQDGTLEETKALFHSALRTPNSPLPLFGRSTHSLAQARAAFAEGFDYIGFGPLFPTPTKLGRPAIGLEEIAIMQREVGSKIPAFCIGGITLENLPQVLQVGAQRVVVVSALLKAQDVENATREVKRVLSAEWGVRSAELED